MHNFKTVGELKAAHPDFFSRKNNRLFGTGRVYLAGACCILTNTIEIELEGTGTRRVTRFAVYLIEDSGLRYQDSFNSLASARALARDVTQRVKEADAQPVKRWGEVADLTGAIIDWEGGELSANGTVELFSHLVRTGMAWTLQGMYGRYARTLIERGWLAPDGSILRLPDEE